MLDLKRRHPLQDGGVLPADGFDFSLDRKQQCAAIEELSSYNFV